MIATSTSEPEIYHIVSRILYRHWEKIDQACLCEIDRVFFLRSSARTTLDVKHGVRFLPRVKENHELLTKIEDELFKATRDVYHTRHQPYPVVEMWIDRPSAHDLAVCIC